MNCEECKEQVFELIEREAVDRDGVHEVLSRCPECRAAFEEMKAALMLAEQLPIEPPPAEIDAVVLRAARAKATKVLPLRKRRLQPPPWAMAAIAMLAVGVGVWSIPREVQFEGDLAPADDAPVGRDGSDRKVAEEEFLAEQALADDEDEFAGKLAATESPAEVNVPAAALERGEAGPEKSAPRRAREKRRSRPSIDDERVGGAAQAPASVAVADMQGLNAEESQSREVTAKASAPEKKEGDAPVDLASACKRKIDDIERSARANDDHEPAPEEELEIGLCYQRLKNVVEARKWLERAAAHRRTKARAEKALRTLAPE